MRVVRHARMDSVSFPGRFCSILCIGEGEQDLSETASLISSDRQTIDALVIIAEDGDADSLPGIYETIKTVRPKGLRTVLITSGINTESIDDLVGSGYVSEVSFRLSGRPSKEQLSTLAMLRHQEVPFSVGVILSEMTIDILPTIASDMDGHNRFQIIIPKGSENEFKRKDLDAAVASLKGRGRNVQVVSDIRRHRDRVRRSDSASCSPRSRKGWVHRPPP